MLSGSSSAHERVQEEKVASWGSFQAPPKHSSSIPPTEPSEAGTGNEWWYSCQLRLRDAIKSDGLKRFWAMTRVQNESGKPHWPAIFASGMIWPNDFNLIWLQSPLPSSIQSVLCQSFASGGQSIGASASASVFPMNIQDWSPLRWTGWISLQSKGLSRVFSNTIVQKHQFFGTQLSLWSNSYIQTLWTNTDVGTCLVVQWLRTCLSIWRM